MSSTKTQPKILTLDEAISKTLYIQKILSNKECGFTLRFMPNEKKFKIIAVTFCDVIKHYFPEFQLKHDERKRRYCELIINYE